MYQKPTRYREVVLTSSFREIRAFQQFLKSWVGSQII
jgi:hypothetical protein